VIVQSYPIHPKYRRWSFLAALLWTIGIFIACLWPGKELPHSDIPFIDKWTHFILFGVFAYLWLCSRSSNTGRTVLVMILIAAALGWFVECLQGWFPSLGRTKDIWDAVADAIGGGIGCLAYCFVSFLLKAKPSN